MKHAERLAQFCASIGATEHPLTSFPSVRKGSAPYNPFPGYDPEIFDSAGDALAEELSGDVDAIAEALADNSSALTWRDWETVSLALSAYSDQDKLRRSRVDDIVDRIAHAQCRRSEAEAAASRYESMRDERDGR